MPLIITSRDFLAGALYLLLGAATIYIGAEYSVGVAGRIGPGYFPRVIGLCLIGLGVISVIRSAFSDSGQFGGIALRPLVMITLSLVLFAYFLNRLGLVVSLAILLGFAAFAAKDSRFSPLGVLLAIALIAACAIVFVKGLGLPTPLIGYWLQRG
jgi:hypothetical protein